MKNLAIITARGGSKRIPRKNIKEFLGKPIIAYSIESAIESKLFDEIMVSTDDEEIALISKEYGAKIPFMRSAKTSDDYSTTNDVIEEVIISYKEIGEQFDFVCCIYPTAPFITADILRIAYDKVITNKYDLVLPIVPFSFPVQRSFLKNDDDSISYSQPENINKRSQDLEQHFHDVGQFYFFGVNKYLQRGTLVGENMFGVEIDELSAQDIDNEMDWKMAEIKYSIINDNQ
jgi:N-acylneuraminate cytidylyltransferase